MSDSTQVSRTHCEDTLRFTPLYIIKIFLDIKYENKNIVIPEVLLELVPGLEETLRNTLNKIDLIARGNPKEIIKYMSHDRFLCTEFGVINEYKKLREILFVDTQYTSSTVCDDLNTSSTVCDDLNTFLKLINHPTIINHDAVKDLIPIAPKIMLGCNHGSLNIFGSVFKYVLYLKIKDLSCWKKNEIVFHSVNILSPGLSLPDEIFFNY